MSAPLALFVEKGEDVTFTGSQIVPPDTFPAGPMDVTAWTILVTIRLPAGGIFLTKPGTVTNGPAGVYTWSLANADTVNAVAGVYPIDIWRTDTGLNREMAKGQLTIVGDVRFP